MGRLVHEELHDHRINNIEWFDCGLDNAKQVIESIHRLKGRSSIPRFHAAWRLKNEITSKSIKYLDLSSHVIVYFNCGRFFFMTSTVLCLSAHKVLRFCEVQFQMLERVRLCQLPFCAFLNMMLQQSFMYSRLVILSL